MTLLLSVVGQIQGVCSDSPACGECESPCSCEPVCNGRGFISADLLYWRAHQGGFVCGCMPEDTNNFIDSSGNVISTFRGHSKDLDFRWDPGFRLGTGYEFGDQSWDAAVYWTHFHTHAYNHHHHEFHKFRWKLDYDVIDVLLGYKFCAESFTFRPFIGIRTALIDQRVKANSRMIEASAIDISSFSSSSSFSAESFINSSSSDFFLSEEHNKDRFRGVGPLIGIEADWKFGCGFSLYACASVSTLYGHFNLRFDGFNTFLGGTHICYKKSRIDSCQISTDLMLGIRWQQCLCNNIQLTYQFALEQHRYYDHNHLGGYGDLCLDGVSFSAGLSF